MATFQNQNTRFTITDIIKREADGMALQLGNALAQTNPIVEDLLLLPANNKLTNRASTYTSLASVSRRRLNQGIVGSKSAVQQSDDGLSVFSDYIILDNLVGDSMEEKAVQIQQELGAKREAMNQQMSFDFFYGTGGPDQMLGLSNRLNTKAIPTVLDAGGSTGLTSAYLITHEFGTIHGFYPEQFPAGIRYVDRGPNVPITTGTDVNGNPLTLFAEVHELLWFLGFSLKNNRRVARLCNIATGSLSKTGSAPSGTGADLYDLLLDTQNQTQNIMDSTRVWYVNRAITNYIIRQFEYRPNHLITRQEYTDETSPLWRLNGIRLKMCEQISNTETQVTATT